MIADILVESDDVLGRRGALRESWRRPHVAQGLVHTEETAAEIRELGRRALALQCDVTDREQVDEMVALASRSSAQSTS